MILTVIYLVAIPCCSNAQLNTNYPLEVVSVLKKSGTNRANLENAIKHYEKSGNPLKLKAIYFLIGNMDIHYSNDYYWADSAGKRVDYNELDYTDFDAALKAFQVVKDKKGKLRPVPFKYSDINTVTTDFLIDNVDSSFEKWKAGPYKDISFEAFCEDILPYRVSTEPLQKWRTAYGKKFEWLSDSAKKATSESLLQYVAADFKTWFINTWDIEKRSDPLPRLGPMQLLTRKKGNCDDIGDLEVYTLRSQGFPARLEHIPFWATTTGRHYFNSTINEHGVELPFDISTASVKIDNFSREPSKVIRITYSKQPSALINKTEITSIPEGFMRTWNYSDVTSKYWETVNVDMKLFKTAIPQKFAFACVFNGFRWQPTWWGEIRRDSVIFTNMCKGAVFLPMYYFKGKLVPAGYPVAYGYQHNELLKPDTVHRRTVIIKEQDKFLKYQQGKKYKLHYWDNGWRTVGEKMVAEDSTELVFSDVPDHTLLLLIPEYSKGKERPFIMSGDVRVWF